jgi:hypothetical protein
MRLSALGAVLLAGTCAAAAPAGACTLTLGTGGTLALSADGSRLASSEAGGAGASLTIVNLTLGAVDVIVSPPQWAGYPAGFDAGGAELAVAYAGSGVLGAVSQPYTTATTRFTVPGLLSLAALLRLDNRISAPRGFASGTYRTRTVVTCAG